MKGTLLASALALVVTGCATSGQDINDHWNARATGPRMARFFLGYDSARDGEYREFAWERKQAVNLTLRRHFLHHNPDNPNHVEWTGRYAPRPVNSILPNPINYIHLEGLLIGAAIYGAGGTFIPLPLDSILGTFAPGGWDEFWDGVAETFGGEPAVVTSTTVGMNAEHGEGTAAVTHVGG